MEVINEIIVCLQIQVQNMLVVGGYFEEILCSIIIFWNVNYNYYDGFLDMFIVSDFFFNSVFLVVMVIYLL